MPDNVAVHVRIIGRVQGVGFRFFAVACAQQMGVTGWVRNNPDGNVEAKAQGPRESVKKWLAQMHLGPPLARVERLESDWSEPLEKYNEFSQLQ